MFLALALIVCAQGNGLGLNALPNNLRKHRLPDGRGSDRLYRTATVRESVH
jgi:hypothetical protein